MAFILRQLAFFLFFFVSPVLLYAQLDTLTSVDDSAIEKHDSIPSLVAPAQAQDTTTPGKDSTTNTPDSLADPALSYNIFLSKLLEGNYFLNPTGKSIAMTSQKRTPVNQEGYFYAFVVVTALLAFFRFFYTRYFNNLFRVFFNASLRQSQLTDQLLQAKLPSLFFNILFVITGGLYIYLLLNYFKWLSHINFWIALFYCILSLGLIYFAKYITLKFTGWLTGFKEITNTYIFIIFLINKILGIILIPFIIIIAFAAPHITIAAISISLLLIGLMFLLRFFRSYGILQHKIHVSRTHFFLYVFGIEILPLLLISKALVLLLSKNL